MRLSRFAFRLYRGGSHGGRLPGSTVNQGGRKEGGGGRGVTVLLPLTPLVARTPVDFSRASKNFPKQPQAAERLKRQQLGLHLPLGPRKWR